MADGSFKVAAVQMLSFEGEQDRNLTRMLARIDEAAAAGARLVVFPEASNNGYFFEDRADAYLKATPIPGPFTDALGWPPANTVCLLSPACSSGVNATRSSIARC